MSERKWAWISDPFQMQALVCSIIGHLDPRATLFKKPGQDAGIDAKSGSGHIVYQSKYCRDESDESSVFSHLQAEAAKIAVYSQADHKNFPLWKDVTEWVLVTNVVLSPRKRQLWEDRAKEAFEKTNIAPAIWDQAKIDCELDKFSDVSQVFFNARNRVFLTPPEAWECFCQDQVLRAAADAQFVGRDAAMADAQSFLRDDSKKLLLVTGPARIGKTRFLFEVGNAALELGWLYLWANTATMQESDSWFDCLFSGRKVLLLIDEPDSRGFVRKLREQLRGSLSQFAECKVVLSARSSRGEIVDSVDQYSSDVARIDLNRLDHSAAKELVADLTKSLGWPIQNSSSRDAWFHGIASAADDYPGWIDYALKGLGPDSGSASFPVNTGSIVDRYVAEICSGCSNPGLSDPAVFLALIRWIALVQPVNMEDSASITFLAHKTGIVDIQILNNYVDDLCRRAVLVKHGRFRSLHPQAIVDDVLLKWLCERLDDRWVPSAAGRSIVTEILNPAGELSESFRQRMLEGLVRMERSVSSDNWPLIDCIFDQYERAFEGLAAPQVPWFLALFESIAAGRPGRAASVIRRICSLEFEEELVHNDFIGDYSVGRADVIRQLAWHLFLCARYADDTSDKAEIVDVMFGLAQIERISLSGVWDRISNDGRRAKSLLSRIVCGGPDFSSSFVDVAEAAAVAKLSLLHHVDTIDEGTRDAVEALVSPLLSLQRSFDQLVDKWTLQFTTMTIHPTHQLATVRARLKSELWGFLDGWELTDSTRAVVWGLLAEGHRSANSASMAAGDENSWTNDITIDLKRCVSILEAHVLGVKERQAARKLWEWHALFDKREELKALADHCRELEEGADSEIGMLFSARQWEDAQKLALEAGIRLGRAESPGVIADFVHRLENFGGSDASRPMPWIIQGLIREGLDNPCLWDFVLSEIGSWQPDRPSFRSQFVFHLAASRLNRLRFLGGRDDEIQSFIGNLLSRFEVEDDAQRFFVVLYSNSLSYKDAKWTDLERERILTIVGLPSDRFRNVEPDLFRVLSVLLGMDWNGTKVVVEGWFASDSVGNALSAYLTLVQWLFFSLHGEAKSDWMASGCMDWLIGLMIWSNDIRPLFGGLSEQYLENLVSHFGKASIEAVCRLFRDYDDRAKDGLARGDGSLRSLPNVHAIESFVEVVGEDNAVVNEVQVAVEGLMNLISSESLPWWLVLPEIIGCLDPLGLIAPQIAVKRLGEVDIDDNSREFLLWAGYASSWPENSEAWRSVAIAAADAVSRRTTEIRYGAYRAIFGSRSHGGWMEPIQPGSPDPYYEMDLRQVRQFRGEEKVGSSLCDYWDLRERNALSAYEAALLRADEGEIV